MINNEGKKDSVFIGEKPLGAYISACLATMQHNDTIHVLARGKNISKAIDVGEILKRQYRRDIELVSSTEIMKVDKQPPRRVSSIEIIVKMKKTKKVSKNNPKKNDK